MRDLGFCFQEGSPNLGILAIQMGEICFFFFFKLFFKPFSLCNRGCKKGFFFFFLVKGFFSKEKKELIFVKLENWTFPLEIIFQKIKNSFLEGSILESRSPLHRCTLKEEKEKGGAPPLSPHLQILTFAPRRVRSLP